MRNSLKVFSCEPGNARIASGYNFLAATIEDKESKSALIWEVMTFISNIISYW
jgi:hypothetical protein